MENRINFKNKKRMIQTPPGIMIQTCAFINFGSVQAKQKETLLFLE